MEHIYRVDHQRLIKCTVDYKPVGRSVGRPCNGRDGCSVDGTGYKPTPVSYTHLDVYKRQLLYRRPTLAAFI